MENKEMKHVTGSDDYQLQGKFTLWAKLWANISRKSEHTSWLSFLPVERWACYSHSM